ncbi:hypothetical protein F0562_027670 [Nyssa sinensis]|uniref:Uncharacterized protein n=1 Tax=Nyssa sinensis TaxID=561372 RepID=A0A5J5B564_9ASTE|nr:hypothetical protein F0562_027670 [Nyssa sinensis]
MWGTWFVRSGEIFKTHILGCPCVMLASPESAHFVLVSQAHLFKPTYPKSKENLIGPSALFFHQGDYHIRLRKLVQGSLSPEAIRNSVADIEAIAVSALDSWSGGHVINTFNEMKKFSFEVGILAIFGHLESGHREELKTSYNILDRGYNSFPTNIPGTPYQKALSDTTASVMAWIVKYLHDDPKLLEAVKAEQKAIYQSNDGGDHPLTWTQTRNMPITYKVVLEALRMASIISFTFREAVADVEYKGRTKTQYIYAIWQWSACMSRARACQAGDAHYDPPPGHQVQVGSSGKSKRDSIWAIPCTFAWTPSQILESFYHLKAAWVQCDIS